MALGRSSFFIIILTVVITSISPLHAEEKYSLDYFMTGLDDKTCEHVKGFAETHGYDFENYWSGTAQTIAYYSYKIGCTDLFFKAIEAGANPIYGGYSGDLVATIISKSTEVNSNDPNACKNGKDWLTLIKNTGADLTYRLEYSFYTNEELLEFIEASHCKELKEFLS